MPGKPAQPTTLADFFQQSCKKHAPKTAYTWRPSFRRLSWTYKDIENHALLFAQILQERKVNKGERVLLIAYNSPYWVAAFFGIQLRGAIAVPLSPDSTPAFAHKVASQTKAKLMYKNRFVHTGDIALPAVFLEEVPKPTSNGNPAFHPPDIRENDIAEIVYTSGTTGDPKGVILTHKNILSNVWASRKAIPVRAGMRFASILPLFHMFEQVGGMLVPLAAGAQVSYAASLSPNHVRWIFQDDQTTRMLAVPEFLRLLHLRVKQQAREEKSEAQLNFLLGLSRFIPSMAARRFLFRKLHSTIGWHMITIVSGGAALDKETGRFWEATGMYILQGYGLTETSPVLTANRYHDRNRESAGKPLEGVLLRIAEDGEILAKGPNVFSGYWKNDKATKDVFDEEGWFHTGDIGEFDSRGHVHIKGRKKFMIVLPSGENVYAEDLEFLLKKQPRIIDSAVIGLKKEGGEEVHAVLLLNKEQTGNLQEVLDRVNHELLPYQTIRSFSVWPEADFPRTATRKIKRQEVARTVEARIKGQPAPQAKPSGLSKVERIIAQVLEIPEGEMKDSKKLVGNFNLDSLRRIELVARIENELAVAIDESQISQHTTVGDLKALVAEKHHASVRYPFKKGLFSPFALFFRALVQPLFLKPALFLYAPARVQGLEHLEDIQHPVLFFSNHLSTADGAVIYGVLPGRIRQRLAVAAASDVVYESETPWIKYSRWFLELLFPPFPFTRREGQIKASLLYAGRIIDRGFSVLVFPEGQTSKTGKFQHLKQGAGLLGVEMGVPIVPCKLTDTQKIIPSGPEHPVFQWPKRHRVRVVFGKPFTVHSGLSYREATALIEKRMRAL